MRSLRFPFALFVTVVAAGGAAVFACGGTDDQSPPLTSDGGADAAEVGVEETGVTVQPGPDANVVKCTLDNGSDPVGLCAQKVVLQGELFAAMSDAGVAAAWDSLTGTLATDGGARVHDFHDDAALGAALANYLYASELYGDTEILDQAGQALVRIAETILAELPKPPAEYDGALYFNLRAMVVGLHAITADDDANKIAALADAYGASIYGFFHAFGASPLPDAGANDAGDASAADAGDLDAASDAAPTDAAPADAGGPDAALSGTGIGGFPANDGILGVPSADQYAYDTASAVTGARALLDMAVLHKSDDASANAALWQQAAGAVLDHVWRRARDPQTALYYTSLVTSADPVHDTVATPAAGGPSDFLDTTVQATVALAYLRAHDLADANTGLITSITAATLDARGEDVIARLNATPQPLWDPSTVGSSDAGSGYFEGYTPSTGTVVKTKPVRGNALLFAVLHRANVISGNAIALRQLLTMRAIVLNQTPANTSFLTQLPNQNSYLLRTSPRFGFVTGDNDAAAPGATLYVSAANHSACEGLNEQWVGLPGH
jgi:hypothetical protein